MLGVLHAQHGRYPEAARLLSQSAGSTGNPSVYVALGRARRALGDRNGALEAYRKALAAHPDHPGALVGLAHLSFSSAARVSGGVEGADPSRSVAWMRTATDLAVQGRLSEAADAFARVYAAEAVTVSLGSEPGSPLVGLSRTGAGIRRVQSARAMDAGSDAYRRGDTDAAREAFQAAAALDPELADAELMLGLMAADAGELSRAEVHFRSALFSDPANAPAYVALGTVQQERGDLPGAMQTYRRALRLDPNAPGARVYLAQAYAAQGNRDSARAVLRRAIRHNPEDQAARDMLEEL